MKVVAYIYTPNKWRGWGGSVDYPLPFRELRSDRVLRTLQTLTIYGCGFMNFLGNNRIL